MRTWRPPLSQSEFASSPVSVMGESGADPPPIRHAVRTPKQSGLPTSRLLRTIDEQSAADPEVSQNQFFTCLKKLRADRDRASLNAPLLRSPITSSRGIANAQPHELPTYSVSPNTVAWLYVNAPPTW